MKRPGEERVRPACHNKVPQGSDELNAAPQSTNSNVLYVGLRGLESAHYDPPAAEDEVLLPKGQSSSDGGMDPKVAKILDEVRFIAKRFRDQDENKILCNEWKFAASVIDRLCLIAFSLITILCTLGILMSAPNFAEAISKDFFASKN